MKYSDITSEQKSLIVKRYLEGKSVESIIFEFDLNIDLVYQVLFETNTIVEKRVYVPKYSQRSMEWKEAVAEYYKTHSRFQTKNFFRTSDIIVDRVIEEFNLPKRTHAEELAFFKIQQYGSVEAYNQYMIQKQKETSIKKYGCTNFAKTDLFKDKMRKTCVQKYGVDNPMKVDEIKLKLSESCKEKFGYDWPCMRPEARIGSWSDSRPNKQFYELLCNYLDPQIIQREFALGNKSYDFRVEKNLIEINPSITHTSTINIFSTGDQGIDKNYHKNKSELAITNGYRCIHVWDWDDQTKIIKLLLPRKRVYARCCNCSNVTEDVVKTFLESYHLQGYVRSTFNLGLFFNGDLVSLMTFGKPRYNKNCEWELLRYCSSCEVVGGAEKLWKHFQSVVNPKSVVSYCDLSKFTGSIYTRLGFDFIGSSISRHWVSLKDGQHITDNLLRQRGFDQLLGSKYGKHGKGTSNEELMLQNKFIEVWDAGQATYIWNS